MKKTKILIVEDENIVAEDIKNTLESLNYTVVGTASTGNDAIEKAKKMEPDLILMDIRLKGDMDGIEAAKKITSKSDIPIVFLTAYSDDAIIEKAKHVKAFGYIVKPFDGKNLNSTIQMTLQKHQDINKIMSKEKNDLIDLDKYDRKILYEVDSNARLSSSSIGNKLRLPKGTINYRICKLIKEGYINKFYTLFNASILGYQYYRILIKFHKLNPEIEKNILGFIKNEGNCLRLRITEGSFNIIFFVIHRNLGELRKFMAKFNSRFGNYIIEKDIITIMKTYKFNQKFLLDLNDYKKLEIDYEIPGDYKMDETDRKIIHLLSNDARIKLVDMSKKIGIDWKVIKYRIQRMMNKGVIVAYTTEINIPKLDREIIQIDISLKNMSLISDMIGFFDQTKTCLFAHEIIGKYDLSVELYIKNDSMIKDILNDFEKRFLNSYIHYDVNHICRDQIINSFPMKIAVK